MKMEESLMRTRESETLKELQKRFVTQFLDLIILARLNSANYVTGYTLVKYVLQKYKILLSTGTVYSTLYYMERKGLIRGEWKDRKRIYHITPEGKQVIRTIKEKIDIIKSLFCHLESISKDQEQTLDI